MTPEEPTRRRSWRTEEVLQQLHARMDATGVDAVHRTRPRVRWVTWAAAAAAMIAVGVASTMMVRTPPALEARVVTTAAGQRRIVHLPDSTVVTLGPESTLRYTIGDSARAVELDGMAAFRVVHHSAHPFVVRARGAEATDLGTEFVVRAYSGDSSVHVAVASGTVALTNPSAAAPTSALTLRAGDVGMVRSHDAPVAVRQATAATYALWLNGSLSFDDEPLAAVAKELGRWFDADIRIADPALAKRRVSAMYHDATLGNVLDALASAMHFEYTRSGRAITVRPRSR
ncbi:MAG: FecR domain-containing protein [Gemmatimonadota bacterium]